MRIFATFLVILVAGLIVLRHGNCDSRCGFGAANEFEDIAGVDHEAVTTGIRMPKNIIKLIINPNTGLPPSAPNFVRLANLNADWIMIGPSASQTHSTDIEGRDIPASALEIWDSWLGRLKVAIPEISHSSEINGGSQPNISHVYVTVDYKPLSRLTHFDGRHKFDGNLSSFHRLKVTQILLRSNSSLPSPISLSSCDSSVNACSKEGTPSRTPYRILYASICAFLCGFISYRLIVKSDLGPDFRWDIPLLFLAFILGMIGFSVLLDSLFDFIQDLNDAPSTLRSPISHGDTVTQKLLTMPYYCNTLIAIGRTNMANVLSTDKQAAIISALAEGSGIRQIERITGVHRDTIMRLGVRVGKGCATLLDRKMQNLPCHQLQFDEIWGFIGKKERHCTVDDAPEIGDVWTFCAIDSDTKIVPSFKVGKRDSVTANAFVSDVASRMRNRVQISSDALKAYIEAVEQAFGANVDFAQIVKTYTHDESQTSERKYSAARFVISEKNSVSGFPNMALASTSHVERLNGTTRLHMRRLTRLTYAFSKKRENFEAAVALHFAYYNFVKRHITLRATPAMAAGIERDFWTVGDLVEAVA